MFYYSAVFMWPQQVAALYTKDVEWGGWLSVSFWSRSNRSLRLIIIKCTVASATALGSVAAGFIVKWGGNVRWWIIFSSFAMVGFITSLASLTPDSLNAGLALTIIGPFFVGFIELVALALAPLFCAPSEIGVASGLLASIRSAGGSVAVAVYSTILSNRLLTTIPANVGPAALDAGLPQSQVSDLIAAARANALDAVPGITQDIIDAVNRAMPYAYAQAFKTTYLASLGFGGIAMIGCLFVKDSQKHLNDTVERKMVGASEKQVAQVVKQEKAEV